MLLPVSNIVHAVLPIVENVCSPVAENVGSPRCGRKWVTGTRSRPIVGTGRTPDQGGSSEVDSNNGEISTGSEVTPCQRRAGGEGVWGPTTQLVKLGQV